MRHRAVMQRAISKALDELREERERPRKRFNLVAFVHSLLTMEIF